MADGAFYGGVENPGGYGSYGYIVHSDGSIFPASSGSSTSLDTPSGTWAIAHGQNDRFHSGDPKDKRAKKSEYQLHPIGTSVDTPMKDPRYKKSDHPGERTAVFGHVIHSSLDYGSHGCIAVQQYQGVDQFGQDGTVTVDESNQSLEEVQQKIEQRLHKSVDWSKIPKPVPPRGSDRSKTKKGNKVKAENFGVHVGTNKRLVTYQAAELEAGGMVTEGTSSIRVGPPRYPVAAVTHDTTDGTPIANGEDSVKMLT